MPDTAHDPSAHDPNRETTLADDLRRLLPYARRLVPRLAFGMLTAIGAGLVGLAIPQALQQIVNGSLGGAPDPVLLWVGVGVVALLGAAEAGLTTARRQLVIAPGTRFEAQLRVMLYSHLVDLPMDFHDRWTSGQLLQRSVSDIRRVRRWLSFGMIMICTNTLTITIGILIMLATSPILAAVYIAAAIPAFLLSYRARRDYRVFSRLSQDQSDELSTRIEESVHGIRVLKAYGRGRTMLDAFSRVAAQLRGTELAKARSRASVTFVMLLLPELALACMLVIGIFEIAGGSIQAGSLLAVFATATLIGGPLERLSEQFALSMDAKTAIDRYFEVLDVENTLADPPDPVPVPDGPGRVELHGVHFAYRERAAAPKPRIPWAEARGGRRRPAPEHDAGSAAPHGAGPSHANGTSAHPEPVEVLRGVDLVLEPGRTLALTGLTGCGKSTLAQMVPRFYDPDAGAIEIDGVDLRDLTRHEVRRLVSIAFEDSILFSASVRENLLTGAPDADEATVREALDIAQAQFVDDLPAGLDTRIGEEGLSLSGGQRQRLSLARAIIAHPRVLVLDDPLSALDVRTEATVTARLRRALHGTTTLIVAHRPSTVALADRVAVLHDGVIAAEGTHAELLVSSALYRTIIANADAVDEWSGATDGAAAPPDAEVAAGRSEGAR